MDKIFVRGLAKVFKHFSSFCILFKNSIPSERFPKMQKNNSKLQKFCLPDNKEQFMNVAPGKSN